MILIVDMNGKRYSLGYYEFVLPIIEIVSPLANWVVKHYVELTPIDIAKTSAVILSGTPLKDTETLGQPEKFFWLKETDKPVLGICAGMETIGLVYGAPLRSCVEIGMTQVTTKKVNSLFANSFKAYSLHSVCVDSAAEFDILAESDLCIQAIKHRHKEVYGTLFHPEVRNPEILTKFVSLH